MVETVTTRPYAMSQVSILRIDTDVDGVKETKLIAVAGSVAIGHVGLRYEGRRCADVRQLFVVREHRRKGVGGMLLEYACTIAGKHDCETMGLSLAAENEDAWPFYREHGFQRAYEYDDGSWAVCRRLRSAG